MLARITLIVAFSSIRPVVRVCRNDKKRKIALWRRYIRSQQINWLELARGRKRKEIPTIYIRLYFGKQITLHVHSFVTHRHNWMTFFSHIHVNGFYSWLDGTPFVTGLARKNSYSESFFWRWTGARLILRRFGPRARLLSREGRPVKLFT